MCVDRLLVSDTKIPENILNTSREAHALERHGRSVTVSNSRATFEVLVSEWSLMGGHGCRVQRGHGVDP